MPRAVRCGSRPCRTPRRPRRRHLPSPRHAHRSPSRQPQRSPSRPPPSCAISIAGPSSVCGMAHNPPPRLLPMSLRARPQRCRRRQCRACGHGPRPSDLSLRWSPRLVRRHTLTRRLPLRRNPHSTSNRRPIHSRLPHKPQMLRMSTRMRLCTGTTRISRISRWSPCTVR
ncbi:hypothetical protein BC831DRAFT_448940 [Entophlyctis helioformis]|nr:hypothetical protein BC831DRAFT_448940 [Entophlyctis helioformis]